jgi:hypothetical protein
MNSYRGADVQIHFFLTPVLFSNWSTSVIGQFNPGESCSYAKIINYYAMKAYGGVDV